MCIKIISYNVLIRTDLVISSVGNMSDIIIHTFFQIQTTSIAEDESFGRCEFTYVEAVLTDVYDFHSSLFSSSVSLLFSIM